MAEDRDISTGAATASVGATVAAVRRVAAMAERALREAGYTEADGLLQDVMAAQLIAEDSLAMEAAGDSLAKPMAEEALRMAKESWKAVQPVAPAAAHAEGAQDEGKGLTGSGIAYVVCNSSTCGAGDYQADGAEDPSTPALRSCARDEEVGALAAEQRDDASAAHDPRASLAALPAVEAAHPDAPVPVPATAPAPLPDSDPVGRHGREFAIPYGPSAPQPERLFPMPDEPAGAAPDSNAPAGAAGRPKAAKIACATLAAVLLVLAGLVGAAWWGLLDLPDPVQERIVLLPDAHAREGRLNAAETEVPPGSYQMVLNQVAAMSEGSRTLRIAFENPAANAYDARLVLSYDGAVVAETGMVAPGRYVETVELDRALPAGEHELSAAVLVYSGATQVNTMSADVSVRVK